MVARNGAEYIIKIHLLRACTMYDVKNSFTADLHVHRIHLCELVLVIQILQIVHVIQLG